MLAIAAVILLDDSCFILFYRLSCTDLGFFHPTPAGYLPAYRPLVHLELEWELLVRVEIGRYWRRGVARSGAARRPRKMPFPARFLRSYFSFSFSISNSSSPPSLLCALCSVHCALCSVEFYTFRFTTPPAPDPRSPSVPVSPRCPLEYAIGIGLAFAPFGNSVISPSVRQSVSEWVLRPASVVAAFASSFRVLNPTNQPTNQPFDSSLLSAALSSSSSCTRRVELPS